jgi:hypothetical protein
VDVKKSIKVERTLGKDIIFLQSIYVGEGSPLAKTNGLRELKWTALMENKWDSF